MNKNALAELGNFNGTESYHRIRPWNFLITDGVLFLAENAECFWLINEIAIAQRLFAALRDEILQEMQFWSLKPNGTGAILSCEHDTNDVAFHKTIEYTDFPFDVLPKPRIWVAPTSLDGETTIMVAYLPSEH